MEPFSDEYFMQHALRQAQMAFDAGEVPVGAVITVEDKVIGKGYNQTEMLNDVTAHAEMIAITAAAGHMNSKFLDECTLYVTVEPCLMCAGALKWARFHRIVYGASEPKFGFSKDVPNLFGKKTELVRGVLEAECSTLMTDFFKARR